MARKSALSREPNKPRTGGGLTQSLQRLSPGVYRDAGGRLTNQGGRPLPQQPSRMAPPQARPPMVNLPGRMPPGSNMTELISGITGNGNRIGSYGPGLSPEAFADAAAGAQSPWQQQGSPYAQYDTSYQRSPSWQRPPMPPQQMQQSQFLQNQALQGASMGAGAALGGETLQNMQWPGGSRGFYENQMQQYQPIQGAQNAPGSMPQRQGNYTQYAQDMIRMGGNRY